MRPLLLVVCMTLVSSNVCFGTDSQPAARFMDEAPKKWAEYRQLISRHVKLEMENESHSTLSAKETGHQSAILYLEKGCVCLSGGSGNDVEERAWNTDYGHVVGKGHDNLWMLVELSRTAPQFPDDLIGCRRPGAVQNQVTTFSMAMEQACLGQHIWRNWLPYVIAADAFRLISANEVNGEVKVTFAFDVKATDQTIEPIVNGGGYVILDPARYWQIHRAEIGGYYDMGRSGRAKKNLTISNEFQEIVLDGHSIPYVSRHVMTLTLPEGNKLPAINKGRPFSQEYVTNVSASSVGEMDIGRFRLAFYGLPEPTWQIFSHRRGSILIAILVIAVVLGIIVVRRFRKVDPKGID